MAETTTTQPVNIYQLGFEIGGEPPLRMVDDGTQRRIRTDAVDQATLDAAVAAHVADWTVVPPPVVLPPTVEESSALAARLTVVDKVRADTLDDDTVAGLVSIFPDLTAGLQVATGDVYQWDGTLVEALQPHTVEAWWLDLASLPPSLYKVHRTDDGTGPIEWQPGISVTTEDQVWYDGVLYDVTQAHTTQAGWEPPAVPALFTPVEV